MMLNLAPQRADRAAHLTILLSTWLYVFINMATRDFEIVSIAAVVILFIAFTWRRIMYIVITAAVTVLLISIFPFFSPRGLCHYGGHFLPAPKIHRIQLAGRPGRILHVRRRFLLCRRPQYDRRPYFSPAHRLRRRRRLPPHPDLALFPPIYVGTSPAHYGRRPAAHHPSLSALHQGLRRF